MRNISYDTTQETLHTFMSRFGPVKYAVLVKQGEGHKGTGFVQFRDNAAADKLIQLSKEIEGRLDKECKEQRINNKKG